MTREEEIKEAYDKWQDDLECSERTVWQCACRWADEHPKSQWVKVSERLPKKIDGRIRSNPVLVVNEYGEWSVAEYNFDKKEWNDLLNYMNDLLEPVYWQEVELPKELQ